MSRVTEKQMFDRFSVLHNLNERFILESGYGRWCVSLKAQEGSGVERRLSGYLSKPELMLWMDGALEGIKCASVAQ